MSQEQKDYQITKTKTLIDINKNFVNFRATVNVSSNNLEYDLAILTQDELDSGVDIPYQKIKGSFQDTIQVTDNQYQNFYLILKSTLPITVSVIISLQELPQQPQIPQESQQPLGRPQEEQYPLPGSQGELYPPGLMNDDRYIPTHEEVSIKPKNNIWKYLFWGCLILIIVFVVYKFVLKGSFDFSKLFKSKKVEDPIITLPAPLNELNFDPVKNMIKESANETKELIKDMKDIILESTSSLPENITETVKESLKESMPSVEPSSPLIDLKQKNALKNKYKFLF
jgi:hypothetical protein